MLLQIADDYLKYRICLDNKSEEVTQLHYSHNVINITLPRGDIYIYRVLNYVVLFIKNMFSKRCCKLCLENLPITHKPQQSERKVQAQAEEEETEEMVRRDRESKYNLFVMKVQFSSVHIIS